MSLDERQEVVLKTFTRKQLENMDLADVVRLVGEAGPGAKLRGKGLVKDADGNIKYAPEAIPGDFGETAQELKTHAERESTIHAFGEEHKIDVPASTAKPVST